MSKTNCVPPRPVVASRFGDFIIHSGCFSYNSLLVFVISGSIHIPKSIFFFWDTFIRLSIPSGNFFLSTIQSPKDELSVLR